MHEFIPLSEIQKLFTFHPLKTYRLFSRFKQEGRLKELSGWLMRDGRILVSMPQLIVELESDGYKNFLRDENIGNQNISNSNQKKSDDEHMKSFEIEGNQTRDIDRDFKPQNSTNDLSNEIIRNDMKSDENQMISNEIVRSKDEIIAILKTNLERADKRIDHLEKNNESMSKQNLRLTQLTYMLMAPQQSREGEQATPPHKNTQDASAYDPEQREASDDSARHYEPQNADDITQSEGRSEPNPTEKNFTDGAL